MVPGLNSKAKKEASKGLVVIGVTDEKTEIVDRWVEERKPTYPIVILKDRALESFLGVNGFPTAAVIAPDGTLAYSGSAGNADSAVSDAMKRAERGPLWPKAVDKAAKLIEKGDLEKAYGEVQGLLADAGKLSDEDREAAEAFRDYIEGVAADALAKGEGLFEEGFVLDAREAVERFAEADPAFPATEGAKALLEKIEETPSLKEELKGGAMFREAKELEREADFSKAVETYKLVTKRYADTRIAANAREAAHELIRAGMPGYKKVCTPCRQARKACAKHAEDVGLD